MIARLRALFAGRWGTTATAPTGQPPRLAAALDRRRTVPTDTNDDDLWAAIARVLGPDPTENQP